MFKTDSYVLCRNTWNPYCTRKVTGSRRSSKGRGEERALMKPKCWAGVSQSLWTMRNELRAACWKGRSGRVTRDTSASLSYGIFWGMESFPHTTQSLWKITSEGARSPAVVDWSRDGWSSPKLHSSQTPQQQRQVNRSHIFFSECLHLQLSTLSWIYFYIPHSKCQPFRNSSPASPASAGASPFRESSNVGWWWQQPFQILSFVRHLTRPSSFNCTNVPLARTPPCPAVRHWAGWKLEGIFPAKTRTCNTLHHNGDCYKSEREDFLDLPVSMLGLWAAFSVFPILLSVTSAATLEVLCSVHPLTQVPFLNAPLYPQQRVIWEGACVQCLWIQTRCLFLKTTKIWMKLPKNPLPHRGDGKQRETIRYTFL